MSTHKDEMYSKLAEENAKLKARIAELEGARAELQERNRKASDTIVAANDRIKELERKSVQLSEPRRCWHLQGTPEGTRICYLHDGFVRVMGMPEDGDDHNCDEMGCGSLGDHVLMCFPLPTLDRAPAQAEPQDGCCDNCRGAK